MEQVQVVKGANQKDLEIRSEAMSKLNDLPTVVLKNLAALSDNEKALGYFSNPIKFALVKGFLK